MDKQSNIFYIKRIFEEKDPLLQLFLDCQFLCSLTKTN